MKTLADYIYSFFWWFSGTKKEFIQPFSSEHQKYFHIGATIFITWLIATIGGISLFTFVFTETNGNKYNNYIPYVLGVVWGIVILNLDRYMIVTIKKRGTSLRTNFTSNEKLSNFFSELFPALPRFFIAILLGIFISTPLELKLFEKDIKNYEKSHIEKLKEKEIEQIEKGNDRVIKNIASNIYNVNSKIKIKIESLMASKDSKNKLIEKTIIAMKKEKTGETGKVPGKGRSWNKLKTTYTKLGEELIDIDEQLDELRSPYSKYKKYLSQETKELLESRYESNKKIKKINNNQFETIVNILPEVNHLSAKLQMLDEVKKENGVIKWVDFLLKLFVIIIETSPILFKLLSLRGPVESYIDKVNNEYMYEFDSRSKEIRLQKKRGIVDIKNKHNSIDQTRI